MAVGRSSSVRGWWASCRAAGPMQVKVPQLTIYFWIIKILATTVGESAADFLASHVGLGEVQTMWVMGSIFLVMWVLQLALTRYVAVVYWTVIVLISIVGTLVTDNLVDNAGVKLWVTIIIWSVSLAIVFAAWYWSERTLAIHSIYTRKRELFYWFAVLFTFALGTGVGDQFAEGLNLGYWETLLVFVGVIVVDYLAYLVFKVNPVLVFWIAYVTTRPLGASLGDLLAQKRADKGLGLGTAITSAIFLGLIMITVLFLAVTKKDVMVAPSRSLDDGNAQTLVLAPDSVQLTSKADEPLPRHNLNLPA